MKRFNDSRRIHGFRRQLINLLCFLFVMAIQLDLGSVMAAGQQLSLEAYNNLAVQLQTLHTQTDSLSDLQKKVDFSIIRYLHTKVRKDWQEILPKHNINVKIVGSSEILVDIKAYVSDSLVQLIIDNGGTIINKFPQYNAIRARIPITVVEAIAAHSDVKFIARAAEAVTNKLTTSEGDIAHNAPYVRSHGYAGTGVKVGVLSDSADYLAQVQATGDLPPNVTVLQDAPGNSGEGTAIMEIVYDLAPDAPLYFATAWLGAASFASNIIALQNAGCKVIIDDVGYFNESPFQDDVISQAVRTVTQAGVSYFSSAGNDGNENAGNAGVWEGDYVDGGALATFTHAHQFAPGVILNQILTNPLEIDLFWSDPLGASANDYNLYVVDGSGDIIDSSTNIQNGSQDPYESIPVFTAGFDYTGYYVLIEHFSGSGRFLHLQDYRSKLQYSTHGSTKGHPTVEAAFAVSAVSAQGRTIPFTGSESLETYTSDGPRHVFYNPDGTEITPGNLSSSGGLLRVKPDITAADCVSVSTPGFLPFCGTSAAAPHAGAIAALFLSANPSPTPAQIRIALTSTALPAPAFWNEGAGYGIVMADRALPHALTPNGLVVDFGASVPDLWFYRSGAWTNLTAATPGIMAAYGNDMVALFPGFGLYQYDGAAWTQLTAISSIDLIAGMPDRVYVDFTGAGLWQYNGAWTQITPLNPNRIAAFGDKLLANFPGYGLYQYDGASWTQLTPLGTADSIVSSATTAYVDFPSTGLYAYSNGAWTGLTSLSPTMMQVCGISLEASFAGYGLYTYNGSSWAQLTPLAALGFIGISTDLYVDFENYGIYKYNGAWTQITAAVPNLIGSLGASLVANFPGIGLYAYDGSTWSQLTAFDKATSMIEVTWP